MPIITNTGIQVITQDEYVEKLKTIYRTIDKDWILDSNSPDGQFVILVSRMLWELEQQAVEVSNARDPRTATGVAVDDLAALFDVHRESKRQSTVKFDCVGTAGTLVKAGSQIRNTDTLTVWSLDADVTIPDQGSFTALDYGLVTAGVPFEIVTLTDGWSGVENESDFIIGREDETSAELEQKRKDQVTKGSTSMRESVRAAILAVDNVNSANVIENDEQTVVDGQDGNSIHCIVSGGDEMEVCRAIDSKISLGCKTVGTIEHQVTTEDDPYGMPRRFDRPTYVNIWVRYTIVNGDKLPEDAVARVPGYVEDYATGAVTSPHDSNNSGFGMGQSPSTGLMATPLNWAVGQYIAADSSIYTSKIELSSDGTTWVETKIDISRLEEPLFDAERVEVVMK